MKKSVKQTLTTIDKLAEQITKSENFFSHSAKAKACLKEMGLGKISFFKDSCGLLSKGKPDYETELLGDICKFLKENECKNLVLLKNNIYFLIKTNKKIPSGQPKYGRLRIARVKAALFIKDFNLHSESQIGSLGFERILNPKYLIPATEYAFLELVESLTVYKLDYKWEYFEAELTTVSCYEDRFIFNNNLEEELKEITNKRKRGIYQRKVERENFQANFLNECLKLLFEMRKNFLREIADFIDRNNYSEAVSRDVLEDKEVLSLLLASTFDSIPVVQGLKQVIYREHGEYVYWRLVDMIVLCYLGATLVGTNLEELQRRCFTVTREEFNSNSWSQVAKALAKVLHNYRDSNSLLKAASQEFFLTFDQEPDEKRAVVLDNVIINCKAEGIHEVNIAHDSTTNSAKSAVKVSYILDLETGFPIYADVIRANVNDVSTGIPALEDLASRDMVNIIIINDKGFSSKAYLASLISQGIDFCFMARKTAPIKELILEHKHRFNAYYSLNFIENEYFGSALSISAHEVNASDLNLPFYEALASSLYSDVEKEELENRLNQVPVYISLFSDVNQTEVIKKRKNLIYKLLLAIENDNLDDLKATEKSYIRSSKEIAESSSFSRSTTEANFFTSNAANSKNIVDNIVKAVSKIPVPKVQAKRGRPRKNAVTEIPYLNNENLQKIAVDRIGNDFLCNDVNAIISSFQVPDPSLYIQLYRHRMIIETVFKYLQSGLNMKSPWAHSIDSLSLKLLVGFCCDALDRHLDKTVPNVISLANFTGVGNLSKVKSKSSLLKLSSIVRAKYNIKENTLYIPLMNTEYGDFIKLFLNEYDSKAQRDTLKNNLLEMLNLHKTFKYKCTDIIKNHNNSQPDV